MSAWFSLSDLPGASTMRATTVVCHSGPSATFLGSAVRATTACLRGSNPPPADLPGTLHQRATTAWSARGSAPTLADLPAKGHLLCGPRPWSARGSNPLLLTCRRSAVRAGHPVCRQFSADLTYWWLSISADEGCGLLADLCGSLSVVAYWKVSTR